LPLYLLISEGPDAVEAEPIASIADEAILRDVMAVLSRHFARHGRVPERPTVVPLPKSEEREP
jgi:hypothetical protein